MNPQVGLKVSAVLSVSGVVGIAHKKRLKMVRNEIANLSSELTVKICILDTKSAERSTDSKFTR